MRMRFSARVCGVGVLAAFVCAPAAIARERVSVVYCEAFPVGGTAYFAAKARADGALAFSLANWMPNGHLASLGGVAKRQGDAWVYRSMNESSKRGRACVARIRINGRSGAQIAAEPRDACDGSQGYGATIGSVVFPGAAYSGPAPNDRPNVHEDDLGPRCAARTAWSRAEVTNASDPIFKGKVRRFLDAVRRNDRTAAAALVSYPAAINRSVGTSVRRSTLRTKAEFLAQWDRIFTPAYRRRLLAASPDDLFAKDGMAMIGSGLIWFDGSGAKAFNLD